METRLHAYAGKPVPIFLPTSAELQATLAANPYPPEGAFRTIALFLPRAPEPAMLTTVALQTNESLTIARR